MSAFSAWSRWIGWNEWSEWSEADSNRSRRNSSRPGKTARHVPVESAAQIAAEIVLRAVSGPHKVIVSRAVETVRFVAMDAADAIDSVVAAP